ncbi:MAG TPA: hypothetical protein VGN15_09920 [Ktedonobacteraceae bacterium]|nr:hypothetical protein [Ktedonobacteraceae bacterium]
MELSNMQQRASGTTRFAIVQLIALVGWIIVQSLFSLSPFGRSLPFAVMIVVEAIWWIVTLLIMFYLFRRTYNSFVKAALDLENANNRLRASTNSFLLQQRDQGAQEA